MIVGGGGMPDGLMARFVEIAGGKDAKLIYVPCLEDDDATREAGTLNVWKGMGVQQCSMIHTKNRVRANEDDAFLEPLKSATGIWFGGGRQWNLADSYYGTKAHQLMLDVVAKGGIVGGSSAGASIQGNYLARATPIENFRIMAPGYERGGLGFIRGVAIDQHFSQRGRQKDLRSLVQTYPQMLGIGIDEATAIIVRKSTAEVVGTGRVFFYSNSSTPSDPLPTVEEQAGSASQVFNLEAWRFEPP
ncbi:MAG: peptidase S51 [Planctomycetes bacterium]|nr:peptidase S51 [Planctomycetota bacterium]